MAERRKRPSARAWTAERAAKERELVELQRARETAMRSADAAVDRARDRVEVLEELLAEARARLERAQHTAISARMGRP